MIVSENKGQCNRTMESNLSERTIWFSRRKAKTRHSRYKNNILWYSGSNETTKEYFWNCPKYQYLKCPGLECPGLEWAIILLTSEIMKSAFYYQTSLPHYRSIQFLHSALIRYKQWLSIKKLYPAEFFPPTYDIDVIWHAHQTNTEEYRSDTKALLGKLLMHDDSVNERFIGSKLEMGQVRIKSCPDISAIILI